MHLPPYIHMPYVIKETRYREFYWSVFFIHFSIFLYSQNLLICFFYGKKSREENEIRMNQVIKSLFKLSVTKMRKNTQNFSHEALSSINTYSLVEIVEAQDPERIMTSRINRSPWE